MGVSGQRHAPAALYLRGKDTWYTLDRKLGGPKSRSGRRGWKKNPLPCRGPNTNRPARSQTQYCLNYRCSCNIKIHSRNSLRSFAKYKRRMVYERIIVNDELGRMCNKSDRELFQYSITRS
jgi:hypothetical protein